MEKSIKTIVYILVAVAIICLAAVYFTWQQSQRPEGEKSTSLLSWVEIAGAADVLVLEIVPYEEPTLIYKEWKGIRDYLADKLDMEVQLRVARDYRSAINDVGLGVADIAFLTPATYAEARKDYCIQPLLSPMKNDGASSFSCVLIAREDANINSVSDLKNKSFAHGDEKSTCGTLIAHKWMLESNVAYPQDLGGVKYFPNYNAVIQSLISGESKAGAVRESVFNKIPHPGIKIIKNETISVDSVIVSTFDLESGLKERIAQAFLDMNQNKSLFSPINPNYAGWKKAADEDYANFKNLIKEVHDLDYSIPADYCLIKPKCKLAAPAPTPKQ